MPGRTMSPVLEVGWYGKIPAAGDFVHRRLPREVIAGWDVWLQSNLAQRKQQVAPGQERAAAGRIWNFLVPAGVGQGWIQAGCITPSRDRVGRQYALLAVVLLEPGDWHPDWMDALAPAYRQMGAGLRDVVGRGSGADYLDRILLQVGQELSRALQAKSPAVPVVSSTSQDILDILNSGKPMEAAAPRRMRDADALQLDAFNPFAHTSHWWTNSQEVGAMRMHAHGGRLDSGLFNRLFVPINTVRMP